MSVESNKQAANRIPIAFNEGRLEIVDEVLSEDLLDHSVQPGLPGGREGIKALITTVRAAFSDFKVTVVHSVAEGDLVVQHTRNTGTMTGEFRGMKPTGKSATWDIVHIVRFQDGKAVEHWAIADNLAMLQQLGLAPAAPTARAA